MTILEQLGINHTLFYQFLIFVFTFPMLAIFVFSPYLKLAEEREKRTKGGEEAALETKKKTLELGQQYESKARAVSSEIKTIFDDYREQANVEYQSIVTKARAESQKMIDATRARVSAEVESAGRRLSDEIPSLVNAIIQKMLTR